MGNRLNLDELQAYYDSLCAKRKSLDDYKAAARDWSSQFAWAPGTAPDLDILADFAAYLDGFGLDEDERHDFDFLTAFIPKEAHEEEAVEEPEAAETAPDPDRVLADFAAEASDEDEDDGEPED